MYVRVGGITASHAKVKTPQNEKRTDMSIHSRIRYHKWRRNLMLISGCIFFGLGIYNLLWPWPVSLIGFMSCFVGGVIFHAYYLQARMNARFDTWYHSSGYCPPNLHNPHVVDPCRSWPSFGRKRSLMDKPLPMTWDKETTLTNG